MIIGLSACTIETYLKIKNLNQSNIIKVDLVILLLFPQYLKFVYRTFITTAAYKLVGKYLFKVKIKETRFQHKQKIAILTLAIAHLLKYVWML